MASKSTKKTTTVITQQTASSSRSTPSRASTSFSSTPGRSARTPSPARLARMHEKEELTELNDRLAQYIDRMRTLEADNSRLSIKIQESEEVITREKTDLKELYESEIAKIRRSLDDTSKENAQLKLKVKSLGSEFEECKARCRDKDRDLRDGEKQRKTLENKIAELQIKLNDAVNNNAPLEKEVANLRNELTATRGQLQSCKQQLEDETLMRIDLANKLQSTQEQMNTSREVHQTELNETRSRMTTSYEEIDGRVQREYDTRLQEALLQMRAEQEAKIQEAKEDIMNMYEIKVTDLQSQADACNEAAAQAREELKISLKKSQSGAMEISTLKARISELEGQVARLNEDLDQIRCERDVMIAVKDEEIARLKLVIENQTLEYADLNLTNVRLDMELAAYRKLLEGEEARLYSYGGSSDSDSPHKQTPGRGKKRKRVGLFQQSRSNREFMKSGSCKDVVEIQEVDSENGRFIRLFNKGEEEFSIGGWMLKHVCGENETVHKFHRNSVIKPQTAISIWSSNANVTHDPPADLVMKGQRWFIGDDMHTYLINGQGEERADLHMKRSTIDTMTQYGDDPEAATKKDSCVIM